jgi:uncharacterized alkaline shock family protein YloU
MNIVDRVLLFIYFLAVGAISVVMIMFSLNMFNPNDVNGFLNLMTSELVYQSVWIGVFAILLLLTLRYLLIGKRTGKSSPSVDQRTDLGEVRISLETISNLALKAAQRIRGVKDVKAKVNVEEAGIVLSMKMSVDGDQSIPTLSEDLQREVKSYVEEITGLPVIDVTVYITNVVSQGVVRGRVDRKSLE